jgi:hypothetical protein
VAALALDAAGNFYVGGTFERAGSVTGLNNIARWNGQAWARVGTGAGLGGQGASVLALAGDQIGNVYAGGTFTNAGGQRANYVARWNGSAWSPMGTGGGMDGMNGQVRALLVGRSNTLYAAGEFTQAGGLVISRIARWTGSSWASLGSGINGPVNALAMDANGVLYAGGLFTTAGGVAATNIARWNNSSWQALGRGIDGTVFALAAISNGVYAGGSFTTAGTVSARSAAFWNGSTWSGLGSGIQGTVRGLAVNADQRPYAVGDFTNAGGSTARRVAYWNGSTWTGMAQCDGTVRAVLSQGHASLYIGGDFTRAGFFPGRSVAARRWLRTPPGDFDADMRSDLEVFNPPDGGWYVNSASGATLLWNNSWGWSTAQAATGRRLQRGWDSMIKPCSIPQGGYWYIHRPCGGADAGLGRTSGAGARPSRCPGITTGTIAWDHGGVRYGRAATGTSRPWAARLLTWAEPVGLEHGQAGARRLQRRQHRGTRRCSIPRAVSGTSKRWAVHPLAWRQSSGAGARPSRCPGDYNGDGDVGSGRIRYPGWLLVHQDPGRHRRWPGRVQWGWSTAIPVSGDFNGDGAYDLAVYDSGDRTTGMCKQPGVAGHHRLGQKQWGWPGATVPNLAN